MASRFLSFNRFLNKDSPVLVLIGQKNCDRTKLGDLLSLGPDDEVCWLNLAVEL